MKYQRYAIYVTLPDCPLARFGAAWLGWDAATGQPVPHPDLGLADPGLADPGLDPEPLTRTPRKYGLHGTIKPPFRLAEGKSAEGLADAVAAFCAAAAPVTLDGLRLARLGHFLALVPEGDARALAQLAGSAVQELDAFRAPPGADELARRRAKGLSAAQEQNLVRWGYPHVMDCFRFHITLTGALPPEVAERVEAALAPHLAPLLPRPFRVDGLTLGGEDAEGRFHELHRYPLSG